jgi:hypothetical protein
MFCLVCMVVVGGGGDAWWWCVVLVVVVVQLLLAALYRLQSSKSSTVSQVHADWRAAHSTCHKLSSASGFLGGGACRRCCLSLLA